MGIGTLRQHRDYGSADQESEAEAEGLEETLSSNTKADLVAWLEDRDVTPEDLEPGTGSGGNVVKADVVAAVEAVRAGEEPEPRGETEEAGAGDEGDEEEPEEQDETESSGEESEETDQESEVEDEQTDQADEEE